MAKKKVNVELGKQGFQKVAQKKPKAPTASTRVQSHINKSEAIKKQLPGYKVGRGNNIATNGLILDATQTSISPAAILKRRKARKELEAKFGVINW